MDGEARMKEPARVVVVGSVNVDLVVTTERLPHPGETVTGGRFARHWGGKGANQAVAAARHGAEVHFVGAVGNDHMGEASVGELERAGVITDQIERCDDASTGVALIMVDEAGENQIAVSSGANDFVDAVRLEDLLDSFHGTGTLLTVFEVPDLAIGRTLEVGQAAGWRVVCNPAPARDLIDDFRGSGAILTPNRGELAAIAPSQESSEEAIEETARLLAREATGAPVVVTLGAEGALVVTEDDAWRVAPPEVEVRDTTGAGDAFNGVLAATLAEGCSLRKAVELAVAAAAFSTEAEGARDGMLAREELERRMAAQP